MEPATITGWGYALPETVVTNFDLAKHLDTNDKWIVTRTGIQERRVGGTTSGLAVDAARAALKSAGIEPSHVDVVVLATCTPDQIMPAVAVNVIKELGCGRAAGFDLNAACAGFGYALIVAFGLVNPLAGVQRVLLIGSDRMTTITDQDDRSTAILFADGAGAVLIEATPGQPGAFLGADWGTAAEGRESLMCASGGNMIMDGHDVYGYAVKSTTESCLRALDRADASIDDIALIVPHQANIRIIRTVLRNLGVTEDRASVVVGWTGNTSSGSIPIALSDAADKGRLNPGDLILMCGFGAGMSWASSAIRWDANTYR